MENKPKTSSYKRLKPYIKGFQIPFCPCDFWSNYFNGHYSYLDQINLKKLPILLLKVSHLQKWGRFQVLIWTR